MKSSGLLFLTQRLRAISMGYLLSILSSKHSPLKTKKPVRTRPELKF